MKPPNLIRQVVEPARVRVAYHAPGMVEIGAAVDHHKAADFEMTKRIGQTLAQHYPKICWGVRVDHAQGIAMVQIPELMGATGQYVLKLADLASDPGLKAVVRAGGEILERFRLPRGRLKVDEGAYRLALQNKRVRSANDPFPE